MDRLDVPHYDGSNDDCHMMDVLPCMTQIFRFQTRLQRLNSLEATSRAKFNFLEQLYMFHKQQGNPGVTIPVIDQKPLDIWALRKQVANLGGAEQVSL